MPKVLSTTSSCSSSSSASAMATTLELRLLDDFHIRVKAGSDEKLNSLDDRQKIVIIGNILYAYNPTWVIDSMPIVIGSSEPILKSLGSNEALSTSVQDEQPPWMTKKALHQMRSWLIRTGVGHLVPKGPHLVDDKQFEILLGALMDEVEKQSGNKLKVNVRHILQKQLKTTIKASSKKVPHNKENFKDQMNICHFDEQSITAKDKTVHFDAVTMDASAREPPKQTRDLPRTPVKTLDKNMDYNKDHKRMQPSRNLNSFIEEERYPSFTLSPNPMMKRGKTDRLECDAPDNGKKSTRRKSVSVKTSLEEKNERNKIPSGRELARTPFVPEEGGKRSGESASPDEERYQRHNPQLPRMKLFEKTEQIVDVTDENESNEEGMDENLRMNVIPSGAQLPRTPAVFRRAARPSTDAKLPKGKYLDDNMTILRGANDPEDDDATSKKRKRLSSGSGVEDIERTKRRISHKIGPHEPSLSVTNKEYLPLTETRTIQDGPLKEDCDYPLATLTKHRVLRPKGQRPPSSHKYRKMDHVSRHELLRSLTNTDGNAVQQRPPAKSVSNSEHHKEEQVKEEDHSKATRKGKIKGATHLANKNTEMSALGETSFSNALNAPVLRSLTKKRVQTPKRKRLPSKTFLRRTRGSKKEDFLDKLFEQADRTRVQEEDEQPEQYEESVRGSSRHSKSGKLFREVVSAESKGDGAASAASHAPSDTIKRRRKKLFSGESDHRTEAQRTRSDKLPLRETGQFNISVHEDVPRLVLPRDAKIKLHDDLYKTPPSKNTRLQRALALEKITEVVHDEVYGLKEQDAETKTETTRLKRRLKRGHVAQSKAAIPDVPDEVYKTPAPRKTKKAAIPNILDEVYKTPGVKKAKRRGNR